MKCETCGTEFPKGAKEHVLAEAQWGEEPKKATRHAVEWYEEKEHKAKLGLKTRKEWLFRKKYFCSKDCMKTFVEAME